MLTLGDAANDLTGGGAATVVTVNGGGQVTLTQASNLSNAAKWAINGGATLSFNSDAQFGAAPGAAVTDYFTVDNGTLRTTGAFTMNGNRPPRKN